MLAYYGKKVLRTLKSKIAKVQHGYHKEKGLSWVKKGQAPFNKKIYLCCFELENMHLGDQLFFWSPFKALIDSGIDCVILGPTPLSEFFNASKIPTQDIQTLNTLNGDWIISKEEMTHTLHKKITGSYTAIGFEFRNLEGKKPISQLIYKELLTLLEKKEHLKLPEKNLENYIAPKTGIIKNTELNSFLEKTKNITLYNDFVISQQFQAQKRLPEIQKLGETESKKSTLLYIGSAQNKKERPYCPTFITKDLRGELPLDELYALIQHPNVKKIICYDAFLCHLATLYGLELSIVAKNKKNKAFLEERFIPITPQKDIKKTVY